MSYNGSGTFNINTAGQPVVTGTVISSTAFNALTADLATGLSTAITKNGQTTVTANIPFNNFKLTGIGVATATGDALSYGQAATVTSLVASTSITDSGLTSGRLTYASTGGLLADSASLTWDGSYLTAASIKDTALTSGRVTYAGASGLLQDSANLTFNGTTLTAAGFSGPLNGTVGATTPNTGAFTTLSATGAITSTAATDGAITATGTNNDGITAYIENSNQTGASAANRRLFLAAVGNTSYYGVAIWQNRAVVEGTSPGGMAIGTPLTSAPLVFYAGGRTEVGRFSSTGLAVTGTLDATGAIKSTGANLANEASAVKLSYEGSSLSAITAYGADASTAGAFQIASKSSNGSVSGTVLSAKAAQTIALEGASRSSGTGISFPATQSASSDANTLDDYEEGSITPSCKGDGTAGTFTPASYNTAYYTKVGNVVTVHYSLRGQLTGSTGNLKITNLPFAALAGTAQIASASGYWNGLGTSCTAVFAFLGGNEAYIYYTSAAATGVSLLPSSAISSASTQLVFTLTYIVA